MGATEASPHASILFADVKGYSVLIQRDEVGTYGRLQQARALFRQLVGDYGGRIVDEAGDGVLAAFPESGRAVDFALAIQRDLTTAAAWQGESGPLAFRIGLHSGPVHVDGDRLFGHSLIVAQRIQEIAPPGRVCVSDAVRNALHERKDLRFVSLGWRRLKSLEPMHIHRVEAADEAATSAYSFLSANSPTSADDTSVAMLPLENHSPDTIDRLLCDGVTMDIVERLSRFRDLSVIALYSAFQCRGLAHAPNEIAQILGIRYLAIGSIRRSGDRLRISAQLLEAETGRVIWSDRFDGSLRDIFAFQDEVADMIAARLASQLSAAERHRILTSRVPELGAYGLVLRGQDLMTQFRRETNVHARHLFEQAGRLDPEYGRLYAGMSHSFNLAWRYGWEERPEACLSEAVALAEEAIRRDELDARGYAELGCARLYQKYHRQSLAAFEHAVDLNPNDADVLAYMADTVTAMGQPERAVGLLQRAIRLNPCQPDWYLWHLGDAQFNLERYEDTIQTLGRMRDQGEAHRLLAASHALLGNLDKAREHAQEVRRTHPEFSLAQWRKVPPDIDAPTIERYFEGLRLAGLGSVDISPEPVRATACR
jgi:adenylate cyclase